MLEHRPVIDCVCVNPLPIKFRCVIRTEHNQNDIRSKLGTRLEIFMIPIRPDRFFLKRVPVYAEIADGVLNAKHLFELGGITVFFPVFKQSAAGNAVADAGDPCCAWCWRSDRSCVSPAIIQKSQTSNE